jgi:hypothetical protein
MPTTLEMRQALHCLCPHNTVTGLAKTRLGAPHDGGYVIVDELKGVTNMLSFGIGGNVDFESEMVMRGIQQVIMCDHTITKLPREHPSFLWRKQAVGAHDSDTMCTISRLLREHSLTDDHNLFLKCDVEDCEWDLIESTSSSEWAQFSQMVFEFHYFEQMLDPARFARVKSCLEKLAQTHVCVHVHGNSHGPLSLVNGIALPQCLEITYVRRDFSGLQPSWEIFPTSIDKTNRAGFEDYFLGSFRFF